VKKQILFVDDEALVLQGLQRMLRNMRAEWDMTFVESGAKALELLSQTPVDVVVSDMRMPGMNGAQLLAEVMKRFPKTIRLILSGHADQELILKCVGSTHQYLSKPCDPEMLKAAVSRAVHLEDSLRDQTLRQLVTQLDRVPSIPSLYVEIVEKLNDPEVGVDTIGEIIARDMGMTAKILKLVNSSFFGLRRQISSPSGAVAYIGLDTIKSLVLSLHAFSQFEGLDPGKFSIEALWRHSQETANAAKQIARLEKAEQKTADEAFVSGLLHDTGKLILASNFPQKYDAVIQMHEEQALEVVDAEERTFGANHADVGGYLLGLWGLPVPVVEAISFHHCPGKALHKTFSPLAAVHAANALVHTQEGSPARTARAQEDRHYLSELGLLERWDVWNATINSSQEKQIVNI
jgi:HD-like signal output (HDOD) protein